MVRNIATSDVSRGHAQVLVKENLVNIVLSGTFLTAYRAVPGHAWFSSYVTNRLSTYDIRRGEYAH